MRSSNEIIIAAKEQQPVTEEELRMALLVEVNCEYFLKKAILDWLEAVDKPTTPLIIRMRQNRAREILESVFKMHKGDPLVVLGTRNIPGTPENTAGIALSKKIFKAATGVDL